MGSQTIVVCLETMRSINMSRERKGVKGGVEVR